MSSDYLEGLWSNFINASFYSLWNYLLSVLYFIGVDFSDIFYFVSLLGLPFVSRHFYDSILAPLVSIFFKLKEMSLSFATWSNIYYALNLHNFFCTLSRIVHYFRLVRLYKSKQIALTYFGSESIFYCLSLKTVMNSTSS